MKIEAILSRWPRFPRLALLLARHLWTPFAQALAAFNVLGRRDAEMLIGNLAG